jgi:hypothetical protein
MATRIHRRTLLRGLGGAAVAAPFLGSVWERQTKGQGVTQPRQLIVMFTHYGCVTTRWFPVKSHGPLASSDLTSSLAPLAPYAGKVLIPRGIRAMNEWTQNNKGAGQGLGQGNDPHVNACASYFTLQPVTPNSNDPFAFSDYLALFTPRPVGSSLDQIIAQQLSSSGIPLFMRVGNAGGAAGETNQSNISYLKAASAGASDQANVFPGLGTPAQAFTALTGLFTSGTSPSPDTYAATRGKRISDLVKNDLDTLKRFDMCAEDRRKIDAWESILNDAGTVVATNQCNMDLATSLGATQANATAATMGGLGQDVLTHMVTGSLDGADMYSVMAVLSAACNYNPVTVLKYPPNYVFSGLGITVETEGLSHRTGNGNVTGACIQSALSMIQTVDTYYATKFAKLIGMLDGIRNADGSTLLDSSATVWFQEMSDGCAHNLNNLPIVQAGGCGGYFKTGWTINVDDGSPDLTQGNSESQCADGTTNGQVNALIQTTGTPAGIASAPINRYYYALMNALGVKGDAGGFPSATGSGPVTRFGYSDLTTDFCGGLGAVPGATIHNPGEFTALKA